MSNASPACRFLPPGGLRRIPGARRAAAGPGGRAVPSRGREHPEPPCPTRSPFQRDRDRILHATSFRRLTYKTQVFVFHEGDHYRTRLTHSLEVAQIARTIARQLRLDEDLAETLALAHDLGHPPFGHAGERALDGAMTPYGGFDHNAQSLRVVLRLERKYLGFDGSTSRGSRSRGSPSTTARSRQGRAVAKAARRLEQWRSLELASWPSAEAQVAALADDIAYLNHDIDDGLRAGFIALEDLDAVPVAREAVESVRAAPRAFDGGRNRLVYEITRRIGHDRRRRARARTGSRRSLPARPMTSGTRKRRPSPSRLHGRRPRGAARLPVRPRVPSHARAPRHGGSDDDRCRSLRALSRGQRDAAGGLGGGDGGLDERRCARLIADFVAGQTDRFAISEHRRLFDATPELR